MQTDLAVADLGPGVLYMIVERPDRQILVVNRWPHSQQVEDEVYPEPAECH